MRIIFSNTLRLSEKKIVNSRHNLRNHLIKASKTCAFSIVAICGRCIRSGCIQFDNFGKRGPGTTRW